MGWAARTHHKSPVGTGRRSMKLEERLIWDSEVGTAKRQGVTKRGKALRKQAKRNIQRLRRLRGISDGISDTLTDGRGRI